MTQLSSSLSAPPVNASPQRGTFQTVLLSEVFPNPGQPRKIFDEQELEELAESIHQHGLLQPLLVRTHAAISEKKYELIAGERRFRACQKLGLTQVPVLVQDLNTQDAFVCALIENIQRSQLNVLEEAQAYRKLIDEFGLTQEACAQRVGKDRSTVSNALRLLLLPTRLQEDLLEGRLTMGHARAICSLEDADLMLQVRDVVLAQELSVRKTEELCKAIKQGQPVPKDASLSDTPLNPDLGYLADNLRQTLHTKVRIMGNPHRGRIEISFFSPSELDRILNCILS